MENKNLEMMKKLIEQKKQKGLKGSINQRANTNVGKKSSKGFSSNKGGGLFDK